MSRRLLLLLLAACAFACVVAACSSGKHATALPTAGASLPAEDSPALAAMATPGPLPQQWLSNVSSVPAPLGADGRPWLLAAADPNGQLEMVNASSGSSCLDPAQTALAWYSFGGAAPVPFYSAPDDVWLPRVSANADYVVWAEEPMVYNGSLPEQHCPRRNLPWLRILALDRASGRVSEVYRSDNPGAAAGFVLAGSRLVFVAEPPGADAASDYGPETLQLADLADGSQRALLTAQPGLYLAPVALAWPQLIWASTRTLGMGSATQVFEGDVTASVVTGTPLGSKGYTVVPDIELIDNRLYAYDGFRLDEFDGPGATPATLKWSTHGEHGGGLVSARGVLAWAAEHGPELYDIAAGKSYRLDAGQDVWTLVSTDSAFVWQAATGSGGSQSVSLWRLTLP